MKSGPKIKKMLLFTFRHLTTGNIQRKMALCILTVTTDNWQFLSEWTTPKQQIWYIQWNCCTLLLASDNWQCSSQWPSPNPVHWQTDIWQSWTSPNENNKIWPKNQKEMFFQKTKTKLSKYQIQMKIPNALALASCLFDDWIANTTFLITMCLRSRLLRSTGHDSPVSRTKTSCRFEWFLWYGLRGLALQQCPCQQRLGQGTPLIHWMKFNKINMFNIFFWRGRVLLPIWRWGLLRSQAILGLHFNSITMSVKLLDNG